MKEDSLIKKLHLYYDKLNSPTIIIGDWGIVDDKEYKLLKETKITSLSYINKIKNEIILGAETKNKYIYFKYNSAFIATKTTNSEYEYMLKDWSLIAVNRTYLNKGSVDQEITIQSMLKLTGIKLSSKAKKDLSYFVSF